MRVVIVGASDVGRVLAERLSHRHQVLLLDHSAVCLERFGEPADPETSVDEMASSIGVRCVRGDGTSRLVLSDLYDAELHCGLVALTGSDAGNLESGRLARELGFDPVVALMHDPEQVEAYRERRITPIDRAQMLAEDIEQVLHHKGAIIPSSIGLGRGELVEIRLTRSSPVLGRPLKNLALHSWRVAAVFRDEELIVPTGETCLRVEDRVLLVGEPAVLATVTEYLRLGTPQFPRPFGPNVVTLEARGPDAAIQKEADGLACASGAANVVRGFAGASTDFGPAEPEDALTRPTCKSDVGRRSFDLPSLSDPAFATRLQAQRPGVVLTAPRGRGWLASFLGVRGQDALLCDRIAAPVLFARASFPYRRILLPVSYASINVAAAEMAIDITRQLGASLTAINVDLPRYLSGLDDKDLHEEIVPIRRLCELYEVPLEYRHREGNPIRHILDEAKHHDLVVMARYHRRQDGFVDPDVALRVARQAACSVIVLTPRELG